MKNKMKALSILVSMIMITLLLFAMVSCNNGGGEVESCKHDDPSKIEIVPGVDPTCTDTGLTEGMKCTECDTMVVPQAISQALGHTEVIDKAVEPTCIENGFTEGKHCSVCNTTFVEQTIVPALGHTEVIDKAVEPTCTENGLTEGKHCSVCDTTLAEQTIVPALGHTEVIDKVVEPTCTKTGLTEGKHCSVCGVVIISQNTIPTVECVAGNWIIEKEATKSENGSQYKKCVFCGSRLEEEIIPFIGSTGLAYEVNSDGETCTITGIGNCKDTDVVIRATYNGLPVKEIGEAAFYHCTSLTSIVIPDSVTSIGYYAFYDCTSLTSIVIPDSVTSIGDYAFCYCTSLTSIVIGDGVTSIGDMAFYYCTSLTSIVIPDSVTSIGDYAFRYCTSLTSIEVDANNQYYKSIDGNLYSKDGKTLIKYSIGKTDTSFKVPSGVTSIGDLAFSDCTSLTSIVIPDSVTSIGAYAFLYCTSLTSIIIPDSVTNIYWYAFYDCTSLTIYCEAKSKPTGWDNNWNYSNRPVVWGYTVK